MHSRTIKSYNANDKKEKVLQGELRCIEEKSENLSRQLLITKAQIKEARVSRDTALFVMRTSSSVILDAWQNHQELQHERQKRKGIDCGVTTKCGLTFASIRPYAMKTKTMNQ